MNSYGKGWRDMVVDSNGRLIAPTVPTKTPRASKFGNVRTAVHPVTLAICNTDPHTPDGWRTFDSRREAARYVVLLLEQRDGAITGLSLQESFPLTTTGPDGVKREVARFVADFTYTRDGRIVVEDCKGFRTPVYQLKKRWLLLERGIEILET